jgi:thioester reductase-like protein
MTNTSEQPQTPLDMPPAGAGERILITGATGFLGQQIIGVLLEKFPKARLVVLLREKKGLSVQERLHAIIDQVSAPEKRDEALTRIDVFTSDDISKERCGLSAEDYPAVAAGLTRIIHSAATVRFDHPLDFARRINVEGTRNVLDLAEDVARNGRLRSFTYIGTAFVAGERKGLVREDELDVGQSFRNTYEQTKCEAEKLVRSRMDTIPTVIARPSIIVGDSRTGATTSFKTLYWPLKIYAKYHWRTVPGYPDAVIDLVPVDYVAEAAVALSFDQRALGGCFHLCAGPKRDSTLGEIAHFASTFFKVPPPRYISPHLFFALVRPFLYATVWGKNRRYLRELRAYRPYFLVRTVFDHRGAAEHLEPVGIHPPAVSDYLEKLFRYCLDSDWGSKPLRTHHEP